MGNARVSPSICHSTGKCNKTHHMGWPWEIGTHIFPIVWVILPHTIPSLCILHQMGNAWVSLSICHSTGKYNKTHRMGRTWEIGTPTFPVVWALFSIRFPFYSMLHHMGNAYVFSLISHNMGKDSQTYRMKKVWEIGSGKYPTKPIVCGEPGKLVLILSPQYGCFFPLGFHPMVYFIPWEMHGFSHQIFHSIVKPIEWAMPGKLVPILFP